MKLRIVEVNLDMFMAEYWTPEGTWASCGERCGTVEQAHHSADAYVIKHNRAVEFKKRKEEGKNIIKEWEV